MEFIIGTVLAGIPVVLEAYDRYWDLSKSFSTFRHHSRELKKLDTIIKTQKALFRGNVLKLLVEITNDQEKAQNLLSDSSMEKWEALKLPAVCDINRLESLREMFDSWNSTLKLVFSSVTAICLEMESFQTSNIAPVGVLNQLYTRFQLCWKKKEVQDSIKELRDFTGDFNELTTRIVNELKEIQSTRPPAREITMWWKASQLNSLEEYRQIRSASYRLYNTFALRWSCARHQNHAASISLVDDGTSIKSKNTGHSIKFDVAIDYEAVSSTDREAPIWLEVETIDTSRLVAPVHEAERSETESDKVWTGMVERITKYSQPIVVEKADKRLVKKAVRFQSAGIGVGVVGAVDGTTNVAIMPAADDDKDDEMVMISTTATNSTAMTPDSMIDLETIEDFCRHFQIPRPTCSYTCVGYIKDLGLHRFYLAPPERRLPGQQKSLAEIITWISEDEVSRNLPRTVITHLASSLAAAVLQYHSTPWLPETWQSSHIYFFGIRELSDLEGISFTTPYFRVELSKPDKGKGWLNATVATNQPSTAASTTTTAAASTDDAQTPTPTVLARNELLFRFGIVLLELGFSQPWKLLRRRVLTTLPSRRHTDYHAAEKLAQTPFLRNRMGPTFPTIVRKCLGCDFGLGENDLANEELQVMFLVDVIAALQKAERGLRELANAAREV